MSAKDILNKAIQDVKFKKFEKSAGQEVIRSATNELVKAIGPVMAQMVLSVGDSVRNAIGNVKITNPQVNVTTPPVNIPDINVPQPIVNYTPPAINVPEVKMPDEMNIKGWVGLMGVSLEKPLPVQLRNPDGSPFVFGGGTNIITGGASGGKGDHFTIKGYDQSAFAEIMNADGRIKVEGGATSITDTLTVNQLSGANWSVSVTNADLDIRDLVNASDSVSAYQVSGHIYSVNAFLDTTASLYNSDNRLKVSVETGGSGLTDAELRASSVPVAQVSGANWSVEVSNAVTVSGSLTSTGAYLLNGDGTYRSVVPSSIIDPAGNTLDLFKTGDNYVASNDYGVLVYGVVDSTSADYMRPFHMHDIQEDGENNSVVTLHTSGHDKIYDSDAGTWNRIRANNGYVGPGVMRVVHASDIGVSVTATQTGTWNIGTITTVTGITNSVAASIIDSSGIQYSGSNPVPTYLVATSSNSVIAVGDLASDAADTGSSPLKIGGIARQANPTAVAAGDRVSATFDDLGRQIIRNVQVRDLIKTAYVSVTNGTEATLLSATAGSFNDLIMVVASNNCDAAVSVDIRAVAAGNIINTLRVPANGTAGWTPPVPWPQDATGNNWTVDGPDETGRTITVSALFSTEI